MKQSMYDRELALEILTHIYESTLTILKRFETVNQITTSLLTYMVGFPKLFNLCAS